MVAESLVIRRSLRLNADAAVVAALGGDALGKPGGSCGEEKGRREVAVDSADEETGQPAETFNEAAKTKTLVDKAKGKRKAEESLKEAFCKVTRGKTDLAIAKVKSGEGEEEGKTDYSNPNSNPNPNPSAEDNPNPKSAFVTARLSFH